MQNRIPIMTTLRGGDAGSRGSKHCKPARCRCWLCRSITVSQSNFAAYHSVLSRQRWSERVLRRAIGLDPRNPATRAFGGEQIWQPVVGRVPQAQSGRARITGRRQQVRGQGLPRAALWGARGEDTALTRGSFSLRTRRPLRAFACSHPIISRPPAPATPR